MLELAKAIFSLADANQNPEINEPLDVSWFDENTRTNQLAVLMLTACWNDAIDWAECVFEDARTAVEAYDRIDGLKTR